MDKQEEYMTVMPSFEFHVESTSIKGFVTAETRDKAVDILRNVHLGPRRIIKLKDGTELIASCAYEISNYQVTQLPVQISDVKGECNGRSQA